MRISHDVAAIGRAVAAVYGDTSARTASAEATGLVRMGQGCETDD